MSNILSLNKLTKRCGSQTVLDAVDLLLPSGRIYGLIGLNGQGKTTLMRILAGIARPNGGSFSLFGETEEKELRLARRRCGFLIENPIFYSNLSAKQNLKAVCYLKGVSTDVIPELMKLVDLPDDRKPMQKYSTGMMQRYGLAAALVGDPEFLILDEPTNGIDLSGVHDFCELIRSLNRDKGKTFLISSHSLTILKNITSDFVYLHDGRLSWGDSRTPEEYFSALTGRTIEAS